MKVYNINPSMSSSFSGMNKTNKKVNTPVENREERPKVPSNKFNNAMRAAILVPILAGSIAACDRTEIELSSSINPPSHEEYNHIHKFPKITINDVTFSEQTVHINKNLDPDSPVNLSLNNLLNTLEVPKKTEGAFPVNMFWSNGNNIYHMIMDGVLTDDSKYVYHLTDFDKNAGTADNYVLNFTNDGDKLNMTVDSYTDSSKYSFINKGDSINLFKQNEDDMEKVASFRKEMIDQPYEKDKYTVEQTTYGTDTTRVNLDNFVIWSVNNKK